MLCDRTDLSFFREARLGTYRAEAGEGEEEGSLSAFRGSEGDRVMFDKWLCDIDEEDDGSNEA